MSHFNTGASSADTGFLYFGSVDGLVSIPKGTPLRIRPPSPVRITGIERLAGGASQALPPGELLGGFEKNIDDGLAVEFAVLDFAETRHDYAYRLHPADDWTPLGRRRQVTFFGLAPGHYRFEVRGRDVFGQWSSSPPLAFDVVPPFWMTLWFRGAGAGRDRNAVRSACTSSGCARCGSAMPCSSSSKGSASRRSLARVAARRNSRRPTQDCGS